MFEFTNGIDVDVHLCRQEIQVQKAWLTSLVQIAVFTENEAQQINMTLDEALEKMISGDFPWRKEDEDIHINLERYLTERLGDLGRKIHFGRSRNDLIATTLRLFVRDSLNETDELLSKMIETLIKKSLETTEVIVPGTTHLQFGQPVRFGHILCSYGWGLARSKEKSQFAKQMAMKNLPLGSGALSGTTLPIDLEDLAQRLGFYAPPVNSYDSVGDRDFLISGLEAYSSISLHLSRLSEDLIYWSSTPVGLIRLPVNWSTGSSIMPNKRNPDVPELVRAKSAHVIGAQANAYLLMKALPSCYDSDLHELKSVFLRSKAEIIKSISALTPFLNEMEVNQHRAKELLASGHLLATEVANHLTQQGVPFREAYAQTAALVQRAEDERISIEKLSPDQIQQIAPTLDVKWMKKLTFLNTVELRSQCGGTSLKRTLEGINKLKQIIATDSIPDEDTHS